jgi:HSP20 family protein
MEVVEMALIRWEPARQSYSLQREVNRLFGTLLDSQTGERPTAPRRWIPAVDLIEENDRFVLRADLPGVGEDDLEIEVEDRVLRVSGQRNTEHQEHTDGYYRLERASGSFRRSLRLPEGVEAEQIEASFAGGVLEVSIPKPEQRQPKRVAVKAAGTNDAKPAEQAEQVED